MTQQPFDLELTLAIIQVILSVILGLLVGSMLFKRR